MHFYCYLRRKKLYKIWVSNRNLVKTVKWKKCNQTVPKYTLKPFFLLKLLNNLLENFSDNIMSVAFDSKN